MSERVSERGLWCRSACMSGCASDCAAAGCASDCMSERLNERGRGIENRERDPRGSDPRGFEGVSEPSRNSGGFLDLPESAGFSGVLGDEDSRGAKPKEKTGEFWRRAFLRSTEIPKIPPIIPLGKKLQNRGIVGFRG